MYQNKYTNYMTGLGMLHRDADFNLFYMFLGTDDPSPTCGDIVIDAETAEEAAEILAEWNIAPRDASLWLE